jgi:hypothetical protein
MIFPLTKTKTEIESLMVISRYKLRYPNKRGPEVKPVDVVLSDKEFKKRGKR